MITGSNVGLQGEVRVKDQERATLQRCHVDHLANEDKNNNVNIIVKSSEAAEYPYITICGKHDYRKQKGQSVAAT